MIYLHPPEPFPLPARLLADSFDIPDHILYQHQSCLHQTLHYLLHHPSCPNRVLPNTPTHIMMPTRSWLRHPSNLICSSSHRCKDCHDPFPSNPRLWLMPHIMLVYPHNLLQCQRQHMLRTPAP
jgi:hypothetical protein